MNLKNQSTIPDQIIDKALGFYPKLHSTKIILVSKAIGTTMQARPFLLNIFKNKQNRNYVIIANNKKRPKGGIIISEATENAAIGILAHELAHINDYQGKTNLEILILGVKYLFADFRRKYEKEIDMSTIHHGAGEYLLAYTKHVIESPQASKEYKEKLRKYYLGPKEIEEMIGKTRK